MQIVDAVMLFNEIDLLKVRCSEHYPHVDKIIVIEAEKTHSNKPKDLVFPDRKKEFAEWADKMEYVVVPGSEFEESDWPVHQKVAHFNERKQRFYPIDKGLVDPYDWYMHADCDEIIRGSEFERIKDSLESNPCSLRVYMDCFYYYLNLKFSKPWYSTRFRNLHISEAQYWKHKPKNHEGIIGWHFSYLGGVAAVQKKLESFMHYREVGNASKPEIIKDRMENMQDLFGRDSKGEISRLNKKDYLPKYIIDNWDVYKKYWRK